METEINSGGCILVCKIDKFTTHFHSFGDDNRIGFVQLFKFARRIKTANYKPH